MRGCLIPASHCRTGVAFIYNLATLSPGDRLEYEGHGWGLLLRRGPFLHTDQWDVTDL